MDRNAVFAVAARICNQLFALDLVSEKFRQAVNALSVKLLVKKFSAVPFGVFVLAFKAKIRAEVNERLAAVNAFFAKLLRKSVRKRGKNNVAFLNDRVLIFADHIVQKFIRGIYLAELLTLKRNRADRRDLRLGVSCYQPHKLRAGISGRTNNSYLYHNSLLIVRNKSILIQSGAKLFFKAIPHNSGVRIAQ